MKIASIIARYLIALIFIVFGLNGFLHFLPMKPPSSETETPEALIRKRPRVVPAQMLPSWSRKRARTWTSARACGNVALVSREPFHRYKPLLVPTHNSLSPVGNKQLIFLSETPLASVARFSVK